MPRSRKEDTVDRVELTIVVQWLRSLIEKHNLTQNDFANRIGVSTTYVNMLIQAKRKPSLNLLRRIADTFSDTGTLRDILPRAYDSISKIEHHMSIGERQLGFNTTLDEFFLILNQQSAASTGVFTIERVHDRGLEPWGIHGATYALSEMAAEKDFIPGDLVVHGARENRMWGFIHSVGAEIYVISCGYHLKSLLGLSEEAWSESGFRHFDVSQQSLGTYLVPGNVVKVRLLLSPIPNLRTPLVSHPDYQFLQASDRRVVDQIITRLTGYSRGQTGYQPSQQRRY